MRMPSNIIWDTIQQLNGFFCLAIHKQNPSEDYLRGNSLLPLWFGLLLQKGRSDSYLLSSELL